MNPAGLNRVLRKSHSNSRRITFGGDILVRDLIDYLYARDLVQVEGVKASTCKLHVTVESSYADLMRLEWRQPTRRGLVFYARMPRCHQTSPLLLARALPPSVSPSLCLSLSLSLSLTFPRLHLPLASSVICFLLFTSFGSPVVGREYFCADTQSQRRIRG